MTDLQECRRQIDEIDSEILRLFEKRMKVSEDVANYKIRTGKPVFDAIREREKLKSLGEQAHGEFNALGIQEVFQQIMAISRKRQYQLLTSNGKEENRDYEMVDTLPLRNVTVVFQGVEGAYSYAAMRAYFPEEIKSYHAETFRNAMEEVVSGRADYAVLPIENSTQGIVTDWNRICGGSWSVSFTKITTAIRDSSFCMARTQWRTLRQHSASCWKDWTNLLF